MHRFNPPTPPPRFLASAEQAVEEVTQAILQERAPSFKENLWKSVASVLSAAQHGKCGFCECKVPNVTDPDVEHFQPKSEVASLSDDAADWGREIPHLARLHGRRRNILSNRGYWWRAYAFDNYLLACGVCNRKFKLSIFPVIEENRTLPPCAEVEETPLLINPFSGPNPAEHLTFDPLGAVAAYRNSRHGHETIKTCGLYRTQLRESRLEKAAYTHRLIDEFLAAPGAAREQEILRCLHDMGDERFIHCGMVRAIFEQRCGMSWVEFDERFNASFAHGLVPA